jgi:hypothetical protein
MNTKRRGEGGQGKEKEEGKRERGKKQKRGKGGYIYKAEKNKNTPRTAPPK